MPVQFCRLTVGGGVAHLLVSGPTPQLTVFLYVRAHAHFHECVCQCGSLLTLTTIAL